MAAKYPLTDQRALGCQRTRWIAYSLTFEPEAGSTRHSGEGRN